MKIDVYTNLKYWKIQYISIKIYRIFGRLGRGHGPCTCCHCRAQEFYWARWAAFSPIDCVVGWKLDRLSMSQWARFSYLSKLSERERSAILCFFFFLKKFQRFKSTVYVINLNTLSDRMIDRPCMAMDGRRPQRKDRNGRRQLVLYMYVLVSCHTNSNSATHAT